MLDQLIYDNGFALAPCWTILGCGSSGVTCATPTTSAQAAQGATDVVLLASLVGDPICKTYPRARPGGQ